MSKYSTENIKSVVQLHNYFLINWHCTGWCNYHCSYCINNPLRTDWVPEEIKILEAKKLNNLINTMPQLKNKHISLRLIGGEPAFYNWSKILDNIERIDKIGLVSNFSQKIDWYKDFYKYCKKRNIKFFLGLSKHNENTNYNSKAIELIKWCKENNYSEPQIIIVADKDFNKNEVEFFKQNGSTRVRVSILRSEDQNNNWISDKLRSEIISLNKEYEKNRGQYRQYRINFTDNTFEDFCTSSDMTNLMIGGFIPDGFYCSAGLSTIGILPNSDVVLNKCEFLREQVIGNLLKDNINLPNKPILCELNKNNPTKSKCCTLCTGVEVFKNENN